MEKLQYRYDETMPDTANNSIADTVKSATKNDNNTADDNDVQKKGGSSDIIVVSSNSADVTKTEEKEMGGGDIDVVVADADAVDKPEGKHKDHSRVNPANPPLLPSDFLERDTAPAPGTTSDLDPDQDPNRSTGSAATKAKGQEDHNQNEELIIKQQSGENDKVDNEGEQSQQPQHLSLAQHYKNTNILNKNNNDNRSNTSATSHQLNIHSTRNSTTMAKGIKFETDQDILKNDFYDHCHPKKDNNNTDEITSKEHSELSVKECSIIHHNRNRKDSEISALSSQQDECHHECHPICTNTNNTTLSPSKSDPFKKIRNDSEVSSITQPPLQYKCHQQQQTQAQHQRQHSTSNTTPTTKVSSIKIKDEVTSTSGGSKFSNSLSLHNLDDSMNTIQTNHSNTSTGGGLHIGVDIKNDAEHHHEETVAAMRSIAGDTTLLKMRKDSDGASAGTSAGGSLSVLKLDLFSTSTASDNHSNSIINHNYNSIHHDNGERGTIENVNNSERKGSDVSGLTTNALLESMGINSASTANATNSKPRKESDLSSTYNSTSIGGEERGTAASISHYFESRKNSDASAASTLMSIRKESDASALSSLIKDHEEEMMRQETMQASNVNEYSGGRSRSGSMTHEYSGGRSRSGSIRMSFRKESDASALSALIKDHEEEMMRQETMPASNVDDYAVGRRRSDTIRKDSFTAIGSASSGGHGAVDPFENLRKLSDASNAVSLEQLNRSSYSSKIDDLPIGSTKLIGLADMKLKLDHSKDDASVATFEHPAVLMGPQQEESKHENVKGNGEPNRKSRNEPMKTSALDHLDALGPGKQNSEDGSHSTATINDANHKILVDALLMTGNNPSRRNRAESWGGMSDISHNAAALAASNHTYEMQIPRGPSPSAIELLSPRSQGSSYGSFETIPNKIAVPKRSSRERLDSYSSGSHRYQIKRKDSIDFRVRERLESFDIGKSFGLGRERLDSFVQRDRLDSIANLSGIFSRGRDRLDSLASLGEVSLTMSVGDLEEVAEQLEHIANKTGEDSSVPESDSSYLPTNHPGQPKNKQYQRTNLAAPTIQVDSEAVQAAVQAAMAATEANGMLEFLNITSPSVRPQSCGSNHKIPPGELSTPVTTNSKQNNEDMEAIRARARAAAGYIHPDNGGPQPSKPKPKPIKKRPPISIPSETPSKRPKLPLNQVVFTKDMRTPSTKAPNGPLIYSNFNSVTPKRQNFNSVTKSVTSTPGSAMSKGGQSNQKWDEMFECLVLYVKDEKAKLTKGMTKDELEKWEWSGNVPTMYKTKDGKALGRWINNQRSAKSKGTLKREREIKLVSTGLKWSVLTTNAWTDMMKELKIYVEEQTKDGKAWDGNVPTNYKIKITDQTDTDDDKNLGRWINRQRSLYQSGKLKEERRVELEKIGLKWAVLSTTSWQSMYEALCIYVESRKKLDKNNQWDGHVPSSYETDEKPPKRLGKWVTRQRAAYSSKKLKDEYRDKLQQLGLSWESNDNKAPINSPNVAQIVQKQQHQQVQQTPQPQVIQQKKNPTPTVVVPKRPLPQTVAIHRHPTMPNLSVASKTKVNDVPLVASLKSSTPLVASLKSKSPTPITVSSMKPPTAVVGNKAGKK